MKKILIRLKDTLLSMWVFIHTHFSLGRLAVVAFVAFMIFIDENSVVQQLEYKQKIQKLEREIATSKENIERDKEQLNELRSNEDNLEKFAREQYFMQKPDEEIFVIKK